MPTFRFSHPIEVRYADLDPQRHVNNAAIFSYSEQARVKWMPLVEKNRRRWSVVGQ